MKFYLVDKGGIGNFRGLKDRFWFKKDINMLKGDFGNVVKEGGANMLRKYVTSIIPLVGLLKYVTDFRKITSEEIDKNVKYVTK